MKSDVLKPRLSPSEAASIIGVKKQTLAVWRCTGRYPELPYYKVGGRITYCPDDVLSFVEAGKMVHTSLPSRQGEVKH
jgi:hypothetical protein